MKVRYSRDNPPEMLQKLSAEARANNYVTDVYESTALEVPARKADINRPFYSPEAAVYPAERKSPKGYYVPSRYSYLGVCYNTDSSNRRTYRKVSTISSIRNGRAR